MSADPVDRGLRAIPAAEYVKALSGREPNRAGKVRCPFHPDERPSLHLYDDGSFYCFGCGTGGSIYDFAAALWGMSTKGHAFLELRARLAGELRIAACPPTRPSGPSESRAVARVDRGWAARRLAARERGGR